MQSSTTSRGAEYTLTHNVGQAWLHPDDTIPTQLETQPAISTLCDILKRYTLAPGCIPKEEERAHRGVAGGGEDGGVDAHLLLAEPVDELGPRLQGGRTALGIS